MVQCFREMASARSSSSHTGISLSNVGVTSWALKGIVPGGASEFLMKVDYDQRREWIEGMIRAFAIDNHMDITGVFVSLILSRAIGRGI